MRKHPITLFMEANEIGTQTEAAKALGLTQQEVSDYVTWRHIPRLRKLSALAVKLGVSRDLLLPDVTPRRKAS